MQARLAGLRRANLQAAGRLGVRRHRDPTLDLRLFDLRGGTACCRSGAVDFLADDGDGLGAVGAAPTQAEDPEENQPDEGDDEPGGLDRRSGEEGDTARSRRGAEQGDGREESRGRRRRTPPASATGARRGLASSDRGRSRPERPPRGRSPHTTDHPSSVGPRSTAPARRARGRAR